MEDNINKEKPPEKVKDNYKCIKVNLKDILSNKKHISNKVFDIINKNVFRVNKITEKTYFLLRKWVLTNYYNNEYYLYFVDGAYYNYFYNGAYYVYFVDGRYYNYFYRGAYYQNCRKIPGYRSHGRWIPATMICH